MLFVFPNSEIYASTYTIEIPTGSSSPGCETSNACFSLASLTINAGDTVEWINTDTATHTVTSGTPVDGSNGLFDSGMLNPDHNWGFVFIDSGEYNYYCMIHPWMIGEVIVTSLESYDDIDTDKDGIYDNSDQCVYDPETINNYQDSDGCPDDDPIWIYITITVIAAAGTVIGIKLHSNGSNGKNSQIKVRPDNHDPSRDISHHVEVRITGGIEK